MVTCYKAIALSFGYVESNTTAWLIYKAEGKQPSTRREALESFVSYLWDKYTKEMDEHHEFSLGYKLGNKCCQRHWVDTKYVADPSHPGWRVKRETDPVRCPTCEMKYPVTWEFDEELWQEYLWDILKSDCNSYGEHDDIENPYGWSPWMYNFNVLQNQMVIIRERAEVVLTDVLYELHPELTSENNEPDYWEEHGLESPGARDYSNLMDESCVFDSYNMSYHKPKNNPSQTHITQILEKSNGSKAILVDDVWTYIRYNTGDEIWLDYKDGKYEVIKLKDHNGKEVTEWNKNPYGT